MDNDKLIVLDLDETLFHCDTIEPINGYYDYTFSDRSGKHVTDYYTVLRPHVFEFIKYLNDNFTYGVFTAATEDYAKEHIKRLGLNPIFLKHRENCTLRTKFNGGQYYLKQLRKLRKVAPLSKTICIDDKKESFLDNPQNLIKVNPFYGNQKDDTLKRIINYIEDLKNVDNVRVSTIENWMDKY